MWKCSGGIVFGFLIFLSVIMNMISWNIRGAVNVGGKRVVKEMVKKYRSDVFVISESHCMFARVSTFWRRLRFYPRALTEVTGHFSAVWVLCHDGLNVVVQDVFYQVVTIKIGTSSNCWFLSGIYGSLIPSIREELWNYLCHIRQSIRGPWLLIRDFNEILLPNEVKGGEFHFSRADKFSSVLDSYSLIDIGTTGSKFTWCRSIQGRRIRAKRLNRAFRDVS